MDFRNKNILITGGCAGIGKIMARKSLERGVKKLVIWDINSEALATTKHEFQTLGGEIFTYNVDVSNLDEIKIAAQRVRTEVGKIDIVINNAGITKDNLLMRMSAEDFEKVIQTNLNSAFNLTKAVIKPMMKQRSGSIVNMSSIVGIKGNAGQANYAASKAGVIGFTKSIALELGSRNIRCNAIAPGFIETEMTAALDEKTVQNWRDGIPLKRGGQPEDVANACVFLGSDMSAYITGQVLNVDGGMLT